MGKEFGWVENWLHAFSIRTILTLQSLQHGALKIIEKVCCKQRGDYGNHKAVPTLAPTTTQLEIARGL